MGGGRCGVREGNDEGENQDVNEGDDDGEDEVILSI